MVKLSNTKEEVSEGELGQARAHQQLQALLVIRQARCQDNGNYFEIVFRIQMETLQRYYNMDTALTRSSGWILRTFPQENFL